MEAGPRDTAQGTEPLTARRGDGEADDDHVRRDEERVDRADGAFGPDGGSPGAHGADGDGAHSPPADALGADRPSAGPLDAEPLVIGPLGPEALDDTSDGEVTDDGPEPEEMFTGGPEVEVELRPQRRLRIWQLAPIVALAATGSLMFAFPLAFDFGDSGAVIAMLGLLICSCAAGWGMMAARRVGYTWPGLPQRGSGRRPDWRVVLAYVVVVAAVVVLAVWRVARLR
ncbi:hypothetical protein GCM10010335_60830 [Streptomyces galbus]|uniref:Transmembrane protein n=1 Tax=Streptomyces galbus TaxID=33898 RepID=A0A4U5X4W0_STRGB|nr:hypothetical protein E4U92_08025 [Streptomyces galbus]GHD50311.1 hypothetical protein GCM10010335_60830 [Streptomyces galbus]